MAVLALDSHGPQILQSRIFFYFLGSTIFTYYIIAFYKAITLLLLFMEKNYYNDPNCWFTPMNSNLL